MQNVHYCFQWCIGCPWTEEVLLPKNVALACGFDWKVAQLRSTGKIVLKDVYRLLWFMIAKLYLSNISSWLHELWDRSALLDSNDICLSLLCPGQWWIVLTDSLSLLNSHALSFASACKPVVNIDLFSTNELSFCYWHAMQAMVYNISIWIRIQVRGFIVFSTQLYR